MMLLPDPPVDEVESNQGEKKGTSNHQLSGLSTTYKALVAYKRFLLFISFSANLTYKKSLKKFGSLFIFLSLVTLLVLCSDVANGETKSVPERSGEAMSLPSSSRYINQSV